MTLFFLYWVVTYPLDVRKTHSEEFVWWFEAILVLLCLFCYLLAVANIKFNTQIRPQLLAKWNSDYVCLRCASRFGVE